MRQNTIAIIIMRGRGPKRRQQHPAFFGRFGLFPTADAFRSGESNSGDDDDHDHENDNNNNRRVDAFLGRVPRIPLQLDGRREGRTAGGPFPHIILRKILNIVTCFVKQLRETGKPAGISWAVGIRPAASRLSPPAVRMTAAAGSDTPRIVIEELFFFSSFSLSFSSSSSSFFFLFFFF